MSIPGSYEHSIAASSAHAFTFRCSLPATDPCRGGSDVLCHECAKLDIEQSFASAFALYEGARRGTNARTLRSCRQGNGPVYLKDFYYVSSLGNRLSRKGDCKLCKFLASTIPDATSGTYKLLAMCSSESYLIEAPQRDLRGQIQRRPWDTFEHNVFMAVVPELPNIPKTGIPLRWLETDLPKNGSIYRLTQPRKMDPNRIILPRKLQPNAAFGIIRTWLEHCRDCHSFCRPRKPVGAPPQNFRVIDCKTTAPRVVDRPWSEKYVALSYVWGTCEEALPLTVLDAVEVTRTLGEQYLWVDRLCIDQENEEEKLYLFSKMDMIYAGAEFTIVGAAGDARTGLPGVTTKPRKPQMQVELSQRTRGDNAASASISTRKDADIGLKLVGVPLEEYLSETGNEHGWLDTYRHGLRGMMNSGMGEMSADQQLMEEYDISQDHLEVFREPADSFGHSNSFKVYMDKTKELARRMDIPLKEMIPYLIGKAKGGTSQGIDDGETSSPASNPNTLKRPITSASRPPKALPPDRNLGKMTLVSLMREPRVAIRDSQWSTRGWTYQEGILSRRRLVFTEEQVYWECRGMALNETTDLHLHMTRPQPNSPMANYMLSGIFEGDMHSLPNLQYGFHASSTTRPPVGQQIQQLANHIRAYTSRNLSKDSDSLNAFLGIAAHYSMDKGLSLLLGLPVWTGSFADRKPGLQSSFALSLSAWTHAGHPLEPGATLYIADCRRRSCLPSWTWAGWEGRATFSSNERADIEGDTDASDDDSADTSYSDYFHVWTSETWVTSVDKQWSAEMILHDECDTDLTMLVSDVPLPNTQDPGKKWLLTIREPLVLRHMHLMHSRDEWEWRRLMGKLVEIHLSVPMTEHALTAGHGSGELATVLVFASTVPFVWDGVARFLVLRKVHWAGQARWERIGRLALLLSERMMDRYRTGGVERMIDDLPVRSFGRQMVLM